MEQNLIDTIKPLCGDVLLQGSIAPTAAYPARFFTYWNRATPVNKHYDNAPHGFVWEMDVNFYSTDPVDVSNTLEAARKALLAAGWTIGEKGHAVASDEPNYTGRGFTAKYLEI